MSLAARFVIGERLHQSASTRVFRGTDRVDGRPVIIKMPGEHALPAPARRLRDEHELLRGLAVPGVPRVHSLLDGPGELALVLEDDGGESLARRLAAGLLPLGDALDVASQVAEILGQLHSCGVIHKDLNPNNILIRRAADGHGSEKLHASLIDFNLATMLPRELPSLKSPEHLEGTLAYLAPEQSGRMGRTVDYRADLYSLGVTLFQLLTGQLPFASRDALELLHCHIARLPPLASSLNPAVPAVLSRIAARLMAKTADERYRSAFGVRSDLDECRRQLAATGHIGDFAIAQHDPADRFLLPERLYGRAAEVAALEAALGRVQRRGRPELFLVSGAGGIGKSAVIAELHKCMVMGGVFIAGKFDQLQRDSPYSALLAAIGQLLRRILGESEQRVAAWRRRLGRALSGAGAALVEVLPELGLILGPQPPLPEVPPSESRIRFRNAFARLMKALSSGDASSAKTDGERSTEALVLFLDDLQWADAATLEILPQLLADPAMGSLLLIGAHRDGEVGAGHALTAALAEIEKSGCPLHRLPLPPLSEESLSQLVADTLSVPLAEAAPLARLVARKTEGNALHAGAFLTRLYKDELLTFDPEALRWRWDLARIAAAPITDNVVEMLAQRLEALPVAARSLLQLGACIGGSFSRAALALDAADAESDAGLSAALGVAVAEGFLLPQGEAFVFAHDRLQQAAYSTLDDATRKRHHAQLGRLLQARAAAEVSIFELTGHLNQASELLGADERLKLCELNLQAGSKARAAAAFATAFEHFSHGVKLLPAGAWQQHYPLAFALHLGQAECTYLIGRFAETAPLLDQVLAHAQGHDDKARSYFVRGVYFRHIGDTTLATWSVLDGLKEFGIDIPRAPSTPRTLAELLWTQRALGGRSIEQLLALPAMTDARQIAILRMLSDASASAYFVGPNLLTVLLLRMIRLSLEQGNHALSAIAYVFFAAVVGSGLGDFDKGEQMGQLALRLVERYPDAFVESQVKCIYVAIANHFKNPVRAGSQLLIDSWRRGEESGNLTYAVYAVNTAARWSYLIGEPLDATHADCDRYMEAVARTHHDAGYQALNLIRQVVRALQGRTISPTELSAPDFDEERCLRPLRAVQMRVQVQFHNNFRAALCLIFGRHSEGLAHCQKNEPDADEVMLGLLDLVEHYHVYALLLAGQAACEPRGSLVRRRLMWKLAKKLRKLRRWAETSPQNFRHRYLMARAEQRRLRGSSDRALGDYQEALVAARAGGFLRDEALCLERMGELLQSKQLGDAAQLYLRRARAAYRRWGAHAKVAALETAHPELAREEVRLAETLSALHAPLGAEVSISSTVSSPVGGASALDLPTVLKATQALSSELTLDKLLLRMMNVVAESAGAQTAALVLGGRVAARFDSEKGEPGMTEVLAPPEPLESVEGLVPAIVLYAMRRQQPVLLDDAVVAGEFSRDPVVVRRRPRSVLCLPLLHQGEARGALYLENNLTPAAFTAGRAELLATLCTQMAISIDNATLYAGLELKVAERTGELRAAQARLLRLERETTETQMAGGFAHEMRNALTGARMLLVRGYRAAPAATESGEEGEDREAWSLPLENSRTLKEMFLAIRDQLEPADRALVIEKIRQVNGNEQQLHTLLAGIDRGLGRSLGLTRLLLEYAQVGREQRGDSVVSLRQVVEGLLGELAQSLAKDGVAVAVDVPARCLVRAAPEHLDSIVRNLVLNSHDALREQQGERRLEVSVRADAGGESWELRVTDSGIGIAEEAKRRLFEPFFSTKPLTGTGLGLSTVRKLAALNGGDIRFESTAGRGTTFTVRLPIHDGETGVG